MKTNLLGRIKLRSALSILILLASVFAFLTTGVLWRISNDTVAFAESYYNFTGTVVREASEEYSFPLAQPISSEAKQIIADSKYVDYTDDRLVGTGSIDGMTNIWDYRQIIDMATTMVVEFEITFTNKWVSDEGTGHLSVLGIIRKVLAGHPEYCAEELNLHILDFGTYYSGYRAQDELFSQFIPGNKYVIVISFHSNWGDTADLILPREYQAEALYSLAYEVPFFEVKNDNYLEEEKWFFDQVVNDYGDTVWDLMDTINESFDKYTLVYTNNMNATYNVADEKTVLKSGRFIYPSDNGKQVCVIDSVFAEKYNLSVGDNLKIARYNSFYIWPNVSMFGGVYSGTPRFTSKLGYPEPKPAESYVIVGIFETFLADFQFPDYLIHFYNYIFLPMSEYPAETRPTDFISYPSSFSFVVSPRNIDKFLNDVEPKLAALGYTLKTVDNDWMKVKDTFYGMRNNNLIFFLISSVVTLIILTLFILVLTQSLKEEYVIMRILGSSKRLSRKIFIVPCAIILAIVLPICTVSSILISDLSKDMISKDMNEILMQSMSSTTDIVIQSVLLSLLLAILSIAFLFFRTTTLEKKSMVELMGKEKEI